MLRIGSGCRFERETKIAVRTRKGYRREQSDREREREEETRFTREKLKMERNVINYAFN